MSLHIPVPTSRATLFALTFDGSLSCPPTIPRHPTSPSHSSPTHHHQLRPPSYRHLPLSKIHQQSNSTSHNFLDVHTERFSHTLSSKKKFLAPNPLSSLLVQPILTQVLKLSVSNLISPHPISCLISPQLNSSQALI